jgi:putative addiction module CopG family antidote
MPSSYTLGRHFEDFVQTQLASGRYGNASEVLRDALLLMPRSNADSPILRPGGCMTRTRFSIS